MLTLKRVELGDAWKGTRGHKNVVKESLSQKAHSVGLGLKQVAYPAVPNRYQVAGLWKRKGTADTE